MFSKIFHFYQKNRFLRVLSLFIIVLLPWLVAILILTSKAQHEVIVSAEINRPVHEETPVYHTKLESLHHDFKSPKEVTATCLECHTERHREIMKTAHWNWEKEDYRKGEGTVYYGKRTALNNFCIGVQGSEESCTRCHIGYGYSDKNFDFTDQNAIDCLICHDKTGTYKKAKGKSGYPATGEAAPDYSYIAQNVGSPGKANCGICHFWGGGGNNVKHGDMEKALLDCSRDVDVHMAKEGANMECIECHQTLNHNITGRSYSTTFTNTNRVTCEQCHEDQPHLDKLLNKHTQKISCQACHIPKYAKVNATKMTWDWSTSGLLDDEGHAMHEDDMMGNHCYLSIKGSFVWEKNVIPEYIWFNGTADHYLLGEQIEEVPLKMNTLNGDYSCPDSKIIPVKIHRGSQIYDTENNYLIQPKLYSAVKGEGAYWTDFEWDRAARIGMENAGIPYSGKFDFVKTEMSMQINHMVSPKEESVACIECHRRDDGRLENLSGFYMPGRDHHKWVDIAGVLMALFSIGGVVIHSLLRVIIGKKY